MNAYHFSYSNLICSALFMLLLSDLCGQNENCSIPEIEIGQAMSRYQKQLREIGDGVPNAKVIHLSDGELASALREHLCEINDILFRMFESEGQSFFELTDRNLIIPNARIYPFYYHRKPNRDLSMDEWKRDMDELMEQHGIAFSIEFKHLMIDRIEPVLGRISITADYIFYPAFSEDRRSKVSAEVDRKMQLVFDFVNDPLDDKSFVIELRAISGDISKRVEIGYSEFYAHTFAAVESYSNRMSAFWEASDRHVLSNLFLEDEDIKSNLNNESFGNWSVKNTVSWGINLGYAFTFDRFGKHGVDISTCLNFSKIEASFDHNGVGIYSQENDFPAFDNNVINNASTQYWLGFLESARMEASRTSLDIMIGYRYNFMNANRRLIYLSPRFFINNTLSYSNVESDANLGFGFVNNSSDGQKGFGQFTDDAIQERVIENAKAEGGFLYGLGLAVGFSIPMDRAGNIFFSGRLLYDMALGGSALAHRDLDQHYLNSNDFNRGHNYLTDFGDHIRSSRFGISIGLSYLILK